MRRILRSLTDTLLILFIVGVLTILWSGFYQIWIVNHPTKSNFRFESYDSYTPTLVNILKPYLPQGSSEREVDDFLINTVGMRKLEKPLKFQSGDKLITEYDDARVKRIVEYTRPLHGIIYDLRNLMTPGRSETIHIILDDSNKLLEMFIQGSPGVYNTGIQRISFEQMEKIINDK